MPPKSAAKAAQSSDSTTSATDQQENAIMAMCLQKIDPDTHKVDAVAVAEALGYGNPKSLGNRWSAMKKKYDLRVELSFTRPGGSTSPKSPASPKVSPAKVQKRRGRKPKAETAKATEPKAEDGEEAKVEDDKPEDDKVREHEA